MEPRAWNLLLVEDNPGDVRLAMEALKAAKVGTQVTVAKDGEEALAFLHHRDGHAGAPLPDLILLDLTLPKKDGREVLAEIKTDPNLRRIPVVILTGSQALMDLFQAYHLHTYCFLNKPARLEDFVALVKAIEGYLFELGPLPHRDYH